MPELVHYGVKGMHWGVRKNTPTNPNYNSSQRASDRMRYGQGAVKRINRRLNKGMDLAKARKQDDKFRRRRSTAITLATAGVKYRKQIAEGAKVAATLVSLVAGVGAQKIAVKAETNRGRASAAATMGLPRTPSSGPNYAKSKKGVYNISSM